MDLETATAAMFQAHRGTTFEMLNGGVPLELVEIDERRDAESAGARVPFSLLFRGSSSAPQAQQTWRIGHSVLGEFDLFLVPIGPIDGGFGYEAIFN